MAKASELPSFNAGGGVTIGATTAGVTFADTPCAMAYLTAIGSAVTIRFGSDTVGGGTLTADVMQGPFAVSNLNMITGISGSGTVTVNAAYLK